jgi:PAS domain S-box-containing protein
MLANLMLIEALSIMLFAALLFHHVTYEVPSRIAHRLMRQADSVAILARESLLQNQPSLVGLPVIILDESPRVASIKITDPVGNILFVNRGKTSLDPVERAQISRLRLNEATVFTPGPGRWEVVKPIYTGSDLRGFVWIDSNRAWDQEQIHTTIRNMVICGMIWLVTSALLVLWITNSISRPLARLHRGTSDMMKSPGNDSNFPLPVIADNEVGDLIKAFNHMAASIKEQRAGLNETFSLLDSMLTYAPVGLAFFDDQCRLVRISQIFANMTGASANRYVGRTLPELMPMAPAQKLEDIVRSIFAGEGPVLNLEISIQNDDSGQPRTWLANAYPIQTTPQHVRWVGIIVFDTTERKRSEEALRKTEKLAATGRLAASMAHEINNPLEAITNLLFLLHNSCQLNYPALSYVVMAEHEIQQIAEITQQTLRFYRQPTLATHAKIAEILDSVLNLCQRRLNALNIQVERKYDPNIELFCFAGEIRQVFANLMGNAIDATSAGGRLLVRARYSRNWKAPSQIGVRFAVADTGEGMEPTVIEHIFEAFFTTKEATGTGLGLWVSDGIITKHHGLVHVHSRTARQGKTSGTVFEIFIPDNPNLTASAKTATVKAV